MHKGLTCTCIMDRRRGLSYTVDSIRYRRLCCCLCQPDLVYHWRRLRTGYYQRRIGTSNGTLFPINVQVVTGNGSVNNVIGPPHLPLDCKAFASLLTDLLFLTTPAGNVIRPLRKPSNMDCRIEATIENLTIDRNWPCLPEMAKHSAYCDIATTPVEAKNTNMFCTSRQFLYSHRENGRP